MRRNWLKYFSIVLAVTCLLSMTVACGGNGEGTETSDTSSTTEQQATANAGTDEPTDEMYSQLTSALNTYLMQDPIPKFDPAIDIHVASYVVGTAAQMEESIYLDLYREYLGINLIYDWIVAGEQYNNRVNLSISSGEIPDILPVDYLQLYQLIDAGLITDLADAWTDGASDLTKRYYDLGGAETSFETAIVDDKLYAIPAVTPIPETVRSFYIRQDWLDNLGLEAPETLNDMLDVLEKFATDDPDGNGEDDTYAMNLFSGLWGDYTADMAAFANCFGAYPHIWIETENGIEYGGIQPEMKNVLSVLSNWYSKGYIREDFTMMDVLKADDQFARGEVGVAFGTHIAMVNGGQALYRNDKDFEVNVLPLPGVSKDGHGAYAMNTTNQFYIVNKDFEHPEAIVKMLNLIHYFASAAPDALSMNEMDYKFWEDELWTGGDDFSSPWTTAFIRPETIHNNIERVLTVKKAITTGDPQDIEVAKAMGLGRVLYDYWDSLINEGEEMRNSDDEALLNIVSRNWLVALTNETYEIVRNVYQDNLMIDKRGSIVTESMIDYLGTLNTLQLTAYTNIITGDQPLDYFDTFVEQWYANGGQQITDELNNIY